MIVSEQFASQRIAATGATIHVAHGGSGPPLLLLHGYPQTHVMWHRVAGDLAASFHVVCPDLRGYGDSDKPAGGAEHASYAKRAMARDAIEVMAALGYDCFAVAGHDRGARVAHRLARDHADRVTRLCVMDIVPTRYMYRHADAHFATGYYHWFFLIQPDGLPEHMIGLDPDYYLAEKLKRWSAPGARFDAAAVEQYRRCFRDPACIHATCEDYRAGATIDMTHDRQDPRAITCPLLVLWGARGFVHATYDVLGVWQAFADSVRGRALDCGHFLPEEAPAAVLAELRSFFG